MNKTTKNTLFLVVVALILFVGVSLGTKERFGGTTTYSTQDIAPTGDMTLLGVNVEDADDYITFIGYATTSIDVDSIAVGQTTSSPVTVTGASVGDMVFVYATPTAFGIDVPATGWVSAVNTVTVTFGNGTTTAQNLAGMVLHTKVESHQ